jgi:hypothetical protein
LRRRDFETIRALPVAAGPLRLDAATWADLDLDALFLQLDRTLTEPGQQALHAWLRAPTDDLPRLKRRSDAMRALEQSAALREDLQLRLEPLGNAPQGVFTRLLDRDLPSLQLPGFAYSALALVSLGTLGAFASSAQLGFLLAAIAYAIDTLAHYSALRQVTAALPGLMAVQELFGAAQRLVAKPLPQLEPEQGAIRAQLDRLRDLSSAVATIGPARIGDETIGEYLDIFTLRQERLFCRAAPLLAARSQPLAALALRVGELDALQALASWRSGLSWCAPELRAGAPLIARGVRHPLVEKCVPNDVRLSPSLLVTGSNMSGKSVLRWLSAQGALVLAATHDHALTELTGLDNVHFAEQVSENGIAFDHLLKPGPASTTNAIALLRFLGFPAEIIDAAERTRGDASARSPLDQVPSYDVPPSGPGCA